LFYNERNIAEAREKIDARQKEHDKIDKKKDKLEDSLREVKKNAGKKTRDLDRVTQEIRNSVAGAP
jgi:structural maintenance of chromosome 1